MNVVAVSLHGVAVRLEPLGLEHLPGLCEVGFDPELWRWVPTSIATPGEMRSYVEAALDERRRGVSLPFAIVHRASGAVIGSTRFGNIVPDHRRLEIGWTWLAAAHQRTAANTETKLLLLTHAFETLGAVRVELKTDALNGKSRAALLRLGAVEEGTFRSHMIIPRSGRRRDTVYFSILEAEWPGVKERLTGRLQAPPATREG